MKYFSLKTLIMLALFISSFSSGIVLAGGDTPDTVKKLVPTCSYGNRKFSAGSSMTITCWDKKKHTLRCVSLSGSGCAAWSSMPKECKALK